MVELKLLLKQQEKVDWSFSIMNKKGDDKPEIKNSKDEPREGSADNASQAKPDAALEEKSSKSRMASKQSEDDKKEQIKAVAGSGESIKEKKDEIGVRGFSTRVVIIGNRDDLSNLRRDIAKVDAQPGAIEATLLLFNLEDAINWFKVSDDKGWFTPTQAAIDRLLESHLQLKSFKLAA